MLCCVRQLCTTICTHTREQSLKMTVGLGLIFVCLFRFSIACVICFILDYFVLVLLAFIVLGLVFFQCYAKRLARNNVAKITYFASSCLQCFDAVGWAAGRASGL